MVLGPVTMPDFEVFTKRGFGKGRRPEQEVARIVAEHWRDAGMAANDEGRGFGAAMAHACAMVLSALDGEGDPVELGIPEDHPDAERIRQVSRKRKEQGTS